MRCSGGRPLPDIYGSVLWRYRSQDDPAALRRGNVLAAPGKPVGPLAAVIDNGVTVVREDVSAAAGAQIA